MTMAQIWAVIGFMATAMAATVTFGIRTMSLHGRVVGAQIEGLRNEMIVRFERVDTRLDQVDNRLDQVDNRLDKVDNRLDKVEAKVEALDRDVHAISLKVFGGEPPDREP